MVCGRCFRSCAIALLAAVCVGASPLRAGLVRDQLEAIYQPLRAEFAALSPDGRHLAFALRDNDGLHLMVRQVDSSAVVVRMLIDDQAEVQVQFFAWADPTRLVFATDASEVVVVETTSRAATLLASPRTFMDRNAEEKGVIVRVLGMTERGDALTLEVSRYRHEAEVTVEAVRVDLATSSRTVLFQTELAAPGGRLLADRSGIPRVLLRKDQSPGRFDLLPPSGSERRESVALDRIAHATAAKNFTITPQSYLGERSFPLGFDHNAALLYYASNVGRDTFGIFRLNVETGESGLVLEQTGTDLTDFAASLEDASLIFDRPGENLVGIRNERAVGGTTWLDADLESLQALLGHTFTGRSAVILSWDTAREVFLVRVHAYQDPGRYFLFHRKDGRWVEQFRRAALPAEDLHGTEVFSVTLPQGGRVEGFLTLPRVRVSGKTGLVLWFHDGPGQRVRNEYQPDAQALAALGYFVAQINYRGSSGSGRRHLQAMANDFDRVPIEDALATIEELATRHGFDRGRVAAAGQGFGGYLALRAVQLQPEVFRCAVAIDAPLDLAQYTTEVDGARPQTAEERLASGGFETAFSRGYFRQATGRSIAVDDRGQPFTRPIFLLHDRANPVSPVRRVQALAKKLADRGLPTEYLELPPLFSRGQLVARAPVFERIGAFLHQHLEPPRPANRRASR